MDELEAATAAAAEDVVSDDEWKEAARAGRQRVRATLGMMLAGARDDEIAEQLNYSSPQAARAVWMKALGETYDPNLDLRSARAVAHNRLLSGMKALAPRALSEYVMEDRVDPNDMTKMKKVKVRNDDLPTYSKLYLEYVKTLIALEGVAVPQTIHLVTPDAKELELFVAGVLKDSVEKVEEGDIFEEGPDGVFEQKPDEDAA